MITGLHLVKRMMLAGIILRPRGTNVILSIWYVNGLLESELVSGENRGIWWPRTFDKEGHPKADSCKYGHTSKSYDKTGLVRYKAWCQHLIFLRAEGMRIRTHIPHRLCRQHCRGAEDGQAG